MYIFIYIYICDGSSDLRIYHTWGNKHPLTSYDFGYRPDPRTEKTSAVRGNLGKVRSHESTQIHPGDAHRAHRAEGPRPPFL